MIKQYTETQDGKTKKVFLEMEFHIPIVAGQRYKHCVKCNRLLKICKENYRLYTSGFGNVCRVCTAVQKRALYKRMTEEQKRKKIDYSTEWKKKKNFKVTTEKNREYKKKHREGIGEQEYQRRNKESRKRYRESIGEEEFLRRKREQGKRYRERKKKNPPD